VADSNSISSASLCDFVVNVLTCLSQLVYFMGVLTVAIIADVLYNGVLDVTGIPYFLGKKGMPSTVAYYVCGDGADGCGDTL